MNVSLTLVLGECCIIVDCEITWDMVTPPAQLGILRGSIAVVTSENDSDCNNRVYNNIDQLTGVHTPVVSDWLVVMVNGDNGPSGVE